MQDLSYEDRVKLARVIMNILDSWGVSSEGKIFLLSLPDGTRTRSLHRYYNDTPLPDEPQVVERIDHILGIAKALRTTYPTNPKMGHFWLNTRNNRFKNQTPLSHMLDDGVSGMKSVRVHLDCAYDWDTEQEDFASFLR